MIGSRFSGSQGWPQSQRTSEAVWTTHGDFLICTRTEGTECRGRPESRSRHTGCHTRRSWALSPSGYEVANNCVATSTVAAGDRSNSRRSSPIRGQVEVVCMGKHLT